MDMTAGRTGARDRTMKYHFLLRSLPSDAHGLQPQEELLGKVKSLFSVVSAVERLLTLKSTHRLKVLVVCLNAGKRIYI